MKLVSTKFTDLVPVEQFNHKPMGIYDGGHLTLVTQDFSKRERFVVFLSKVQNYHGKNL